MKALTVTEPWRHEPDELTWLDETTGATCRIVRSGLKSLCGYVAVEPGHRYYCVDYANVDGVAVHGGLTYSGYMDKGSHSRLDATDNWWLGFDCAHAGDFVPGIDEALREARGRMPDGLLGSNYRSDDVYRDIEYVKRECAGLAVQLHGV